jgi:Phosphotransferase enzyme family
VDAALAVASAHGLRVGDPVIVDDRLNVIVHLRPAPVVARVSTTTSSAGRDDGWLRREVAVAGFLTERGAPVVGPSGELPAGPHLHNGLWLTFWEYVEHERGRSPSVEEAARLLRELHAVLADFEDELPLLEPVLGEVPRVVDDLAATGGLSGEDAAVLRRAYERLRPRLAAAGGEVQAVHGDAHVGNLLFTERGPLWTDFEETCAAPIEWDLACLRLNASAFGDDALAAYGAKVDETTLDLMLDARALQIAAWASLMAWHDPGDAGRRERAEARLAYWRERE